MDEILVGLDLGTTLAKCVACNPMGQELASASQIILTNRTIASGAEQDPSQWIAALTEVMKQVSKQLGQDARRITAMSVSAHGPGVVLTGRQGQPLLPCAIWQDNRCAVDGYRLFDEIGYEWVGHGLPQTGLAARLKWLARTQPEAMRQAKHIHDIKGYLLHYLTGCYVTEPSSSAGGMKWNEDMIMACGIDPALMDEVVPSTAAIGPLIGEVAKAAGFPSATLVISGLNDGAAAMLGSGAVEVGQGAVSVSTNGIARVVLDKKFPGRFLYDHSMFCWPYVDGKYVAGGFTKSAGDSVQWFLDIAYRDLPDLERLPHLNREAEQSAPGSRGVLFFPWLMGRGSPAATDVPAGCFMGLARHHNRGDCGRAVLEGVAYALRDMGQHFRAMGYDWEKVRLTGGGMKSPLWRNIVCNTLAIEGQRVKSDSLLGAAMLAGVGSGIYASVKEACETCVEPIDDPQAVDFALQSAYENHYQAYVRAKQPLADYVAAVRGDIQ